MAKEDELSPEEKEELKATIDFYNSFDKMIRGLQLYRAKNALVVRLLNDVQSKVEQMVARKDNTVKITPIGPMLFNIPIYEENKVSKYIFQMYRDGIRELTFQQGVSGDELIRFAEVCNTDFGSVEDDIVTLLWKNAFSAIKYYAVDSLGAEVGDDTLENSELLNSSNQIQSSEEGKEMQFSASDMRLLKSRDSLNWVSICSAPYGASANMKQTIEQIDKIWSRDVEYKRFLALVLKVAQQTQQQVPLVENVYLSMITSGQIESVVGMLSALIDLIEKGSQESFSLLTQLCSRENLLASKNLFAEHHETLKHIFEKIVSIPSFDGEVFIELLQSYEAGIAREVLQSIMLRSSVDMTKFYLDGLKDDNENIVLESVEALGTIGSAKAIEALYGSLGHALTSVRRKVLEHLQSKFVSSKIRELGKVLRDPDKDNRLLALHICTEVTEKEVGGVFLAIVQESSFLKRDMDEQELFMLALHKYPSPVLYSFLGDILKDKNLMRSKTVLQRQLLVVDVFKKIGTEDSKSILKQYVGGWFLANEVKEKIKAML